MLGKDWSEKKKISFYPKESLYQNFQNVLAVTKPIPELSQKQKLESS